MIDIIIINSNNIYDWYMIIKEGLKHDSSFLVCLEISRNMGVADKKLFDEAFFWLSCLQVEFGFKLIDRITSAELMPGIYSRNQGVISLTEQRKLWDSKVAVIGCGGGGGLAAECLARTGVGSIVLVDGDDFDYSNRNRQIGALTSTISCNKARIMGERVRTINSNIKIDCFDENLSEANYHEFLNDCDCIASCVDSIENKILVSELIKKENLPYNISGIKGYKYWIARFDNPSELSYYDVRTEIGRMFSPDKLQLYSFVPDIMHLACDIAKETIKQILRKKDDSYYYIYDGINLNLKTYKFNSKF